MFIELGFAVLGLALLARLANKLGFSAIPLYLLAGLAFGNGGLVPLNVSGDFTQFDEDWGHVMGLGKHAIDCKRSNSHRQAKRRPQIKAIRGRCC